MLRTNNDTSARRFIVLSSFVILVFSILAVKFFQIQVIQHNQHEQKANINSIRAESLHAPRGSILDRNGKIIVDNAPIYSLVAVPNAVSDIDSVISVLSNLLNIDSTVFADNYRKNYIGYFAPTRLLKDLTFEQIMLIEEHKFELPGIEYKFIYERNYASQINGSHFLGYIVEVDRKNIKNIKNADDYRHGDLIGWQGLEKYYENHLREQRGVEYKAVDASGRFIGGIHNKDKIPAKPGKDLVTTIDSDLQVLVEDLMSGRRGCAIVGDPTTGEILSFVNSPSYPPDLFTGATSTDDWNKIIYNSDKPLLNRNTHGLYPPGSTLKMIVLSYILEKKLISPNKQYYCSGKYQFGNRVFRCWDELGHGNVNLDKALIQSCDVYFYNVIQKIPIDELAEFSRIFQFGTKTGIDLPSEKKGVVPTTEYLNSLYGKNKWTDGHKLNLSIGQGETLVTPVQLLTYINLIFTHGNTNELHFSNIKQIKKIDTALISESTWIRINKLMQRVITDKKGTGQLSNPKIDDLIVAGKTGTAENPHGEPHAWFIGYAFKGDISRSFVILLENAGHGGDVAAPIAREILAHIYHEPQIEENINEVELGSF